jgi:hypothetical protein
MHVPMCGTASFSPTETPSTSLRSAFEMYSSYAAGAVGRGRALSVRPALRCRPSDRSDRGRPLADGEVKVDFRNHPEDDLQSVNLVA